MRNTRQKRHVPGWVRHLPCRGVLVLTLCASGAVHAATIRAEANLLVGSCNILLDNGTDQVKMRGVLASEFDQSRTASIIPFQMVVQNCNSTKAGHTFDITVTGKPLDLDSNVFSENTTEDVGFMLKENGTGSTNYWPGDKSTFYTDGKTVAPGAHSHLNTPLTEDDPKFTTFNYFVGLVTPRTDGKVNAQPRHLTAAITFEVNYK